MRTGIDRRYRILFTALLAILTIFAGGKSAALSADGGKVIEGATMRSDMLGKEIRYTVYLPPDYDSSSRTYPVFYLLHGGGSPDLDTDWVHKGEINYVMDKGIRDGRITPMIVVMPDGRREPETEAPNYFATYYMNDADGKFMWADMFIEEFIPFIEKEYRVRTTPGPKRGIGGLSMGGYGGLLYSMQHPGMFAVTLALSPGMYTEEQILDFPQREFDRRYGKGFGAIGLEGKERLTEDYRMNHPLALMRVVDKDDLKKLRIFIDCGAEDRFDAGSFEMHHYLKEQGVGHYFTIRPGQHNWTHWREGIVKAMEYASAIFHR